MPLTINTNISALTAQRNLATSSSRSAASLAKLSSGSRVPTAKDDAAALAVGTGLRADVAAFRTAQSNAQQGSALLQVADGAFSQVTDILVRMKTLASQSQSGQISDTERGFVDTEYSELLSEIDRIAATTEFNSTLLLGGSSAVTILAQGANVGATEGFVGFSFSQDVVTTADGFSVFFDDSTANLTLTNTVAGTSQTLNLGANATLATGLGTLRDLNFNDIGVTITINDQFNGGNNLGAGADIGSLGATLAADSITTAVTASSSAATVAIQVGIGITANDQISISIAQGNTTSLGVAGTNVGTAAAADNASTAIDVAIGSVNSARSSLGAGISRLEFAANNAGIAVENLSAAKSVLMDVDVSAEITKFSSQQVLIQAGVSMLAQANQQPSLLLRLLQ